jgi:hypothetical protein
VLLAVEEHELEKVPPTMGEEVELEAECLSEGKEEEECEQGPQDPEDEESERVHVAMEEVEEWEVEL